MSDEPTPESVFDVLGDELARDILALASVQPVSAQDIAEHSGLSLPTVYRRINALSTYDLLSEDLSVEADGNHHTVFETELDRLRLEIADGSLHVDVHLRSDPAGQFDKFWRDLGEGSRTRESSDE